MRQFVDKDLFGVKITGIPQIDILLVAVALRDIDCNFLTPSNKSFTYSSRPLTICSTIDTEGTLKVSTTGSYTLVATNGVQSLTSLKCNTKRFGFNVILKDGSTIIVQSNDNTTTTTAELDATKTYTITNNGLTNPLTYVCTGSGVSSSVTRYSLVITKN
jgi:hypothetical protein